MSKERNSQRRWFSAQEKVAISEVCDRYGRHRGRQREQRLWGAQGRRPAGPLICKPSAKGTGFVQRPERRGKPDDNGSARLPDEDP